MDILKSLILGIVQGLTEFLPVSSSGHIELGKAILDLQFDEEENLLFTVVVHLATVLSTIVVFRKDIAEILKGIFQFKWNEETQFTAKIVLSMVPVAIVGVFFKDQVESLFNGNIAFVGAMLLITAFLLFLTNFVGKRTEIGTGKKVSFTDAILIGLAQAMAVLPGISRSGSTIATGLLLGVDKSKIARFSFLMVLAPIIGIAILDLKDYFEQMSAGQGGGSDMTLLAVGFLGAFLAGWAACTWMINIVKRGKLIYFAIYCAIIGVIAIAVGLYF